jgi:gliding motility-associated-like protein
LANQTTHFFMKKSYLILFFVLFCTFSSLFGQNGWQRRTNDQAISWGAAAAPSGGLFTLDVSKNGQFGITAVDAFGGFLWSKSLRLVDTSSTFLFARGICLDKMARIMVFFEVNKKNSGTRLGNLIVWTDLGGNFVNSSFFDNNGFNTGYPANKILADAQNQFFGLYNETVSGDKARLRSFLFDPNLNFAWAKKYETALSAQSQGAPSTNAAGEYLVCGSLFNLANQSQGGFLMKIDQNGAVAWSKKVSENHVLQFVQLTDGSYIYVASTNGTYQFQDARLVKLDANLTPVWSKKYPTGMLLSTVQSLIPRLDGGFYLILGEKYPATTKTPQVAHFDKNGNLIWSKRFNECRNIGFFEAKIDQFDNLLGNRYTYDNAITYFKMTANGEMGMCSSIDIPLVLTAATVPTLSNLTWTTSNLTTSTPPDVLLSPKTVDLVDFCPPLEFPVAHFTLPDSVCFFEKMQPFYDGNGLADKYLWSFQNGKPDSSMVVPSDSVHFFKTGLANIQLVQSLGICHDTFVDFVRVLPPLPPFNLPNDTTLCANGELVLSAKNTQFFDAISWEDGSNDAVRTVSEDKLVILTGNLGICTLKDSVELKFVQRPDLLPTDTTACADATVLTNFPRRAGDVYFLNENALDSNFFQLKKGRNELKTRTPEGCEISEIIDFLTVECLQSVFIPNIFSPNDDGENDFIEIFGGAAIKKIDRFEIFDRWGNRVFSAKNYLSGDQKGQWNGVFRGKKVLPSVFTWWAELELVDGRRVKKEGDFSVVR